MTIDAKELEELLGALRAAEETLTTASRILTVDHGAVLGNRLWGQSTLDRVREAIAAPMTSPTQKGEICPHDNKPCYVGATLDDKHHRCGTVQCGRSQKGEREEALEAARRVVEAFAWAANYKPHRNRPERDAFHAARALLSSSKAEGEMREALEMHPGDLGLILLQCPVALGMEGHDCNGPDCNCGDTILDADAWTYVNRPASERGVREALWNARDFISNRDTAAARLMLAEIDAALTPKE